MLCTVQASKALILNYPDAVKLADVFIVRAVNDAFRVGCLAI